LAQALWALGDRRSTPTVLSSLCCWPMGSCGSRSPDPNSKLANSVHVLDTNCSGSMDCQDKPLDESLVKALAEDASHRAAADAAQMPAAADAAQDDALEEKFLTIEQGLQAYCENPTATAFMQIYTCIYNLCNERKRKHLVCKAVYDKYRVETSLCAQQLRDSMSGLCGALETSWQEPFSRVLHSWCHLQRRIHALQASFGYLDRYYVPRSHLATLSDVRLAVLQEAGLDDHAVVMWSAVAAGIRDGQVRIGCSAMQTLAATWVGLIRVAGLEQEAMFTCVADALREHVVVMLSSGRPGGTAVDRVLRTQPPLVQLIADYLSEQDLFEVYSVEGVQRSK